MLVVTEEYKKWRGVIFAVTPEQVDVSAQEADRVYGILMDIGMRDTSGRGDFALSLTAFPTGESSFRPTPGGGIVGLGGDAKVSEVAKAIVQIGQQAFASTQPTTDFASLPEPGKVRFTFLTTSGVRFIEDRLEILQSPQSPFSKMLGGFGFIRNFAMQLEAQKGKK